MRIGTARRSGLEGRVWTAFGWGATTVIASAAPVDIVHKAAAQARDTSSPQHLVPAVRPPIAPPRWGLPAAALCEDVAIGRFRPYCSGLAATAGGPGGQ